MKSPFLLSTALTLTLLSSAVAEEFQFKPAQTGLASIFSQIAESLEHYGTPEPYLRHILSEQDRIIMEYRQKRGREIGRYLPDYMTEEYVDSLMKTWAELAPNLKLERLAKESGRLMKLAIDGENGKGTSLIVFFNFHQDGVYNEMISGEKRTIGYKALKTDLLDFARSGDSDFLARREEKLSAAEREDFRALIGKARFTKSDFALLDKFYGGPYDQLSEYGKALLSERVFAGQRGESVPISDAAKYSAELLDEFQVLFGKFDDQLSPETAEELRAWVSGVSAQVGVCASVEYELGIKGWAISN